MLYVWKKVDPIQGSAASDLVLHCLQRRICPQTGLLRYCRITFCAFGFSSSYDVFSSYYTQGVGRLRGGSSGSVEPQLSAPPPTPHAPTSPTPPPPPKTPRHPFDSKFHFHGKFWIDLGYRIYPQYSHPYCLLYTSSSSFCYLWMCVKLLDG